MQERLTKQIAVAVTQAVQPSGVAVIIEGMRKHIIPIFMAMLLVLFGVHYDIAVEHLKTEIHKHQPNKHVEQAFR